MRDGKRRLHSKTLAFLVLSLALVAMSAFGFNLSPASAASSVDEVVMTKKLSNDQQPLEPTLVFDQADTFYASVKVSDLQAGSQVTARWFRGDQKLDEYAITVNSAGSGNLGFNLTSQSGTWPIDAYSVEIYLNNVLAKTAPFAVKPPAGAIPSRVKSATMTLAVDGAGKATQPVLVFGPSDIIHTSVNADLGLGSQLVSKWYAEGQILDAYTTTITAQENKPNSYFDLTLKPTTPLVPGSYSVEVVLDGKLARAMDFIVQAKEGGAPVLTLATPGKTGPAMPQPPSLGPIRFSTDPAGQQSVPPFPAGTRTIYATFDYQGFRPGSTFEQIWSLEGQETGRGSFTWTEAESGSYQGSLANDQGLLSGAYKLEIKLDGQTLGSGEFVIGQAATAPIAGTPIAISTLMVVPLQPGLTPQPTPGSGTFFGKKSTPTLPMLPQQPTLGPIRFSADAGVSAPTTIFPMGAKTVYATFDYQGFAPGANFEQIWYLEGQETGRGNFAWTEAESGSYQTSLANDQGLLSGNYSLEIKLNGQSLGSGQFIISAQAQPTAQALPQPPLIIQPIATISTQPQPIPTVNVQPVPVKPKPAAGAGKLIFSIYNGSVHSLWLMNLDGTGRKLVTDQASDPSWSFDGKSVAFYAWDGSPHGASGVYQINADGTNARQIWNQGSAEYLDWAKVGRYVAMNTVNPSSGKKRLVVYDSQEGSWRDIGPGEQPSFSPDANSIVAKTCIGSECGLFIMGRDGSGKRRLTNSADDAMPSWSPTGNRIAYASQQNSNWDIWVINADGSGKTQITQDPAIDAMPVWTSDGQGIVYRSTRGGSWNIRAMNANGSGDRKITDAPAAPDWGRDRQDVY